MQHLRKELNPPPYSYPGPVHPLTLGKREMEGPQEDQGGQEQSVGREGASDGWGGAQYGMGRGRGQEQGCR